MQQNFESRSSYLGTSGNTYVFKNYQNIAARFHVLKFNSSGQLTAVDSEDAPDLRTTSENMSLEVR
jgi:hypothetical protein